MSYFSVMKWVILRVDLNNISLDDVNFDEDDPETIIHVRLMAWHDQFKQSRAHKKELSKELMLVAGNPTRLWDWYKEL